MVMTQWTEMGLSLLMDCCHTGHQLMRLFNSGKPGKRRDSMTTVLPLCARYSTDTNNNLQVGNNETDSTGKPTTMVVNVNYQNHLKMNSNKFASLSF